MGTFVPKLYVCLIFAVSSAGAFFPAFAQSSIPKPVIEQCNTSSQVSRLPDCLKSGAVAHEMIQRVQSDYLYGNAARPVLDACSERNETFDATWTCFRVAAETAAETYSLIGLDNIADHCVAGISDPAIYEETIDIFTAMRRERFPDEVFFGANRYFPFQGCPDETGEPIDITEADFGTIECTVFAEVENIISGHSADELRKMVADAKSLPDETMDALGEIYGLSEAASNYLLSKPEEDSDGMKTAVMVGVFLRQYHPELLNEALDSEEMIDNPATEIGGEFADAFFNSILDSASEKYNSDCGES